MLDPLTVVELLNVAKIEAAEFASSSLVRALGVSEHPWVLKSLHSSESSIWRADQFADEVLCLVVNVIPLLTIEVELACGHRLHSDARHTMFSSAGAIYQDFLTVLTIQKLI